MRRASFVIVMFIFMVALTASTARGAPCWQPPVTGIVVDPFREPACPYCAGNRGIEYRVGHRAIVRAVASGIVTYAGVIAGTRYVVVRHANGWRTTYGELSASRLDAGDVVLAGRSVGVASATVHFGVRAGGHYLDPAPFLGRLVARPRLVPTDGTPPRPAPPATWRCSSPPGG